MINITPLIDVMFLLLIFFMVSSTFRDEFAVDVTLPEAVTAEQTEASEHVISVNEEGALFFNGQAVDESGLAAAIRGVMEAEPEASLVLKADESADFGDVMTAIDVARSAGGSRLVLPARLKELAGDR
jgi:biopolymer transport protein ExbD